MDSHPFSERIFFSNQSSNVMNTGIDNRCYNSFAHFCISSTFPLWTLTCLTAGEYFWNSFPEVVLVFYVFSSQGAESQKKESLTHWVYHYKMMRSDKKLGNNEKEVLNSCVNAWDSVNSFHPLLEAKLSFPPFLSTATVGNLISYIVWLLFPKPMQTWYLSNILHKCFSSKYESLPQ